MMTRLLARRHGWLLLRAFATTAAIAWAPAAWAGQVSGSNIASIALANVGDMACTTNSLGGTGYYTSCSGYGGQPEYWSADFARWVWNAAGVDVSSLSAAASSFETYAVTSGTWHDYPAPGDVVVFDDPGSGGAEHVAIVVQVNSDGTIETVSGDWDGSGSTESGFAGTSSVVLNSPAYSSIVGQEPATMGMVLGGYASPVGLSDDAGVPTGPCADVPCWGQRHRHAVVDINGDGKADLCGRGPAGVSCWLSSGSSFPTEVVGPALSDTDGWNQPQYDSTIQFADVDGDGKSDVCARAPAGFTCWLSQGTSFGDAISTTELSDAKGWDKLQYYSTIQLADVDGDGKADVCGRGVDGLTCLLSTGSGFGAEIVVPDMSDAAGWDQPQYYSTIQLADVNGDGKADLCARGPAGFECWLSTGTAFGTELSTSNMGDSTGWNNPEYFTTIQMADVNGDGKADVCGRGPSGFLCVLSTGTAFSSTVSAQAFSSTGGWNQAMYHGTIQLGDVNGDGKADVCGRSSAGFVCYLSTGSGFGTEISTSQYSDGTGWSLPRYYTTLQLGDVNGDGKADVCGRGATEVICELSNGAGFQATALGPTLSDSAGWSNVAYYETLALVGGYGHGHPDAGHPDAGHPDAGHPDAGHHDAGAKDSGSGHDAGDASVGADAGPDAPRDAGSDGFVDAGSSASTPHDAGEGSDAAPASRTDSGGARANPDAGSAGGAPTSTVSTGCTSHVASGEGAGAGLLAWASFVLVTVRRRRRWR